MTSPKDPPDGGGAADDGGGGGGSAATPGVITATPTALNSPSASQAAKAASALLAFATKTAVFAIGEAPAKDKKNAARLKTSAKRGTERARQGSPAGATRATAQTAKPKTLQCSGSSSKSQDARKVSEQKTSETTSASTKSGKKKRGKGRKTGAATSAQTDQSASEEPNVWAAAHETLLCERKRNEPVYDDEVQYAEAYKICRQDYRIMPDGYQREPTKEEIQAEMLWRQRKIFLAQEPKLFYGDLRAKGSTHAAAASP